MASQSLYTRILDALSLMAMGVPADLSDIVGRTVYCAFSEMSYKIGGLGFHPDHLGRYMPVDHCEGFIIISGSDLLISSIHLHEIDWVRSDPAAARETP